LNRSDWIQIVETALAALDRFLAENTEIPPDLRSRLIDQRGRLETLRMRLSLAAVGVPLSPAEMDGLRRASYELDALDAETASIDNGARLLDLTGTIGSILDSGLSRVSLLAGDDPTRPKG
jgi:hypothetical protein